MPKLTDPKDLRERILEESKGYVREPKQDDEFTVGDFQEINSTGRDQARDALNRMEADGKVEKRKAGARIYYKLVKEQT